MPRAPHPYSPGGATPARALPANCPDLHLCARGPSTTARTTGARCRGGGLPGAALPGRPMAVGTKTPSSSARAWDQARRFPIKAELRASAGVAGLRRAASYWLPPLPHSRSHSLTGIFLCIHKKCLHPNACLAPALGRIPTEATYRPLFIMHGPQACGAAAAPVPHSWTPHTAKGGR